MQGIYLLFFVSMSWDQFFLVHRRNCYICLPILLWGRWTVFFRLPSLVFGSESCGTWHFNTYSALLLMKSAYVSRRSLVLTPAYLSLVSMPNFALALLQISAVFFAYPPFSSRSTPSILVTFFLSRSFSLRVSLAANSCLALEKII